MKLEKKNQNTTGLQAVFVPQEITPAEVTFRELQERSLYEETSMSSTPDILF